MERLTPITLNACPCFYHLLQYLIEHLVEHLMERLMRRHINDNNSVVSYGIAMITLEFFNNYGEYSRTVLVGLPELMPLDGAFTPDH